MPSQEQLHPFGGPTCQAWSDIAVEARDLCRMYGSGQAQVVAFDNANLSVWRGEFVVIMGPSGPGKSTLLYCPASLDIPNSGQSRMAGHDITDMSDDDLTRMRCDMLGFIFQSFNLLPSLSAEENILLPLRLVCRSPDRGWYDAIIAALGTKNHLMHHPSGLSGSQQQRVAVARVLVGRPEVVFANEPTGALNSELSDSLLEVLVRMCDALGQTVVMVIHDRNAAVATNRAVWLRDDRIIDDRCIRRGSAFQASPPGDRPVVGQPRRQGEVR